MDLDAARKRRRSISSASSSSSVGASSHRDSRSPSPAYPPAPKYHRAQEGDKTFTCNLPPTCSQPSTSTAYSSEVELARHQETFHRWVCRTPIKDRYQPTLTGVPENFISKKKGWEWKECGKVFPNERLLNLHQTETHDPIMKAKQGRGEKIFQCFVAPPECTRTFQTPAKRRRHLIDKHLYPEQYFFSITNHGINRIAQEDGLAISLIRPRRVHAAKPDAISGSRDGMVNLPPGVPAQDITQIGTDAGQSVQPVSETGKNDLDMDMDNLVQNLESSLQFVPRKLRKAQT